MTQSNPPVVARTRAELTAAYEVAGVRPRAVVMTMGALHSGHGELITAARAAAGPGGHVTVTIFVNPTQFAANEDLAGYPRTFEADLALCQELGADLVFAPTPDVVYPYGDPDVTVDPGELGAEFEGVARPTHFRGVLTVVAKLLALTTPAYALFGEKDFQQLTLIRRMERDLDLGIRIIGVPTVRDTDGLALSSRNKYLSAAARETALRIPAAIQAGQAAGPGGAEAVIAAAQDVLAAPGAAVELDVQYVAVTGPLMEPAPAAGEARLIITAIVDGTRLLDNAAIRLGAAE